jgi:hypothetical protein
VSSPRPVRVTIDLTPAQYRRLTAWAAQAGRDLGVVRVSLANVVRAFVATLGDPEVSAAIRFRLGEHVRPRGLSRAAAGEPGTLGDDRLPGDRRGELDGDPDRVPAGDGHSGGDGTGDPGR